MDDLERKFRQAVADNQNEIKKELAAAQYHLRNAVDISEVTGVPFVFSFHAGDDGPVPLDINEQFIPAAYVDLGFCDTGRDTLHDETGVYWSASSLACPYS